MANATLAERQPRPLIPSWQSVSYALRRWPIFPIFIIIVLLVVGLFAPWLSPHDPLEINLGRPQHAPRLVRAGNHHRHRHAAGGQAQQGSPQPNLPARREKAVPRKRMGRGRHRGNRLQTRRDLQTLLRRRPDGPGHPQPHDSRRPGVPAGHRRVPIQRPGGGHRPGPGGRYADQMFPRFGNHVDEFIMRVVEITYAVPTHPHRPGHRHRLRPELRRASSPPGLRRLERLPPATCGPKCWP